MHLFLRFKDFIIVATLKAGSFAIICINLNFEQSLTITGSLELNPLTKFQWLVFCYEKLMFGLYRIIVLWYFMPLSHVVR